MIHPRAGNSGHVTPQAQDLYRTYGEYEMGVFDVYSIHFFCFYIGRFVAGDKDRDLAEWKP